MGHAGVNWRTQRHFAVPAMRTVHGKQRSRPPATSGSRGTGGAACPCPPSTQPAPGEFSAAKVPSQGTSSRFLLPLQLLQSNQVAAVGTAMAGWVLLRRTRFFSRIYNHGKKYFTYTREHLVLVKDNTILPKQKQVLCVLKDPTVTGHAERLRHRQL